jgi:mycothiol synthase
MAVSLRLFRWTDLPALADLQSRAKGGQAPVRADDLRLWLSIPTLRPEENCFLAEDGDDLVGFLQVFPEQPIGRIVVDWGLAPERHGQGIAPQLMERAFQRARELGVEVVHAARPESRVQGQRLLKSLGFAHVRQYRRMRRENEPAPELSLPPGLSLGPLQPGEAALLARIQNAAFQGSWGFSPNTAEDIASRLRLPGCAYDGVLVVRGKDEAAAYCWTRLAQGQPDSPLGEVWMTAVVPEHRGTGLGRVIVRAGIRHLLAQGVRAIELDVDEANDSARHVYFTEGFRDLDAILWFEQRL